MIGLPLVSVIVLSYNNKDFLTECINSILMQQYNNIEIIIADDCSTDGSVFLLEHLPKEFPEKIKLLLSAKNEGITVNSNKAVKMCSGKYVAWMGSDDVMLPGKINKQVAYMEANSECNISYHNLEVFESETNKILYYFNNKFNAHTGKIDQLIKHGTFNGACATMTRSAAAPSAGLDSRIPVASDWLYWVDHLANGGEIHYINEVLGRYRRHVSNVTSQVSSYANQGYKDLLTTISIISEKYPQYDKEIKYRLSYIYLSGRRLSYAPNLIKSIKNNFFNIKSWILITIYYATFKKVKL